MRTPFAATLALLALGGAVTLAAPPGAAAQSGALYRTDEPSTLELQREAQELGGYDDRRQGRDQYDGVQRGPSVRVWLENDRDLFSPGALTRVYVRAAQDAFVSVIHITPDGDVEMLWPRDPNDEGYLEGGRAFALSTRTGSRYVRLGYGYGIGYIFAVSSDEPLDVRRMRDFYYRRTSGWSRDLNVVGDPFHAMERFARDLVPGYEDGYGSLDWYSYHVGSSRYRYPRYACYDSYGPWYSSRSPYYDGCDRVRVLLVEVPYYYDTRYWRGDRSYYWRRWYASDYNSYYARRREPQHGYKESPYGSSRSGLSPNRRPMVRGGDAPPPRSGGSRYGGGRDDAQEPRVTQPGRTRPTLQRRPQESEPVQARPRSEPRSEEPRSRESRPERTSEPRVREAPAPRRESPPARSAEPRRESPPPRSDGGGTRSEPSRSPRVRPQG
ncbi:MAG TPA: hypothetical protein VFS20_28720 [Longimicrobium sp.]|nr:hypothetical protein [Longimicrobium sp.]